MSLKQFWLVSFASDVCPGELQEESFRQQFGSGGHSDLERAKGSQT
jgi:hypothetical protein